MTENAIINEDLPLDAHAPGGRDGDISVQDLAYLNAHLDLVEKYNSDYKHYTTPGKILSISYWNGLYAVQVYRVDKKPYLRHWKPMLEYVQERDNALTIFSP